MVATASYGQLSETFGHKNVSLMYGKSFGDLQVTAMGFGGRGHRSDREYKDAFGTTVKMEDANELAPSFFNLGVKYKDFGARALVDNYYLNNMDGLVKVRPQPTKIKMEVSNYELQYNPSLTDTLKLNSSFVYSYQSPLEIYYDKPPGALLRKTLVKSYTGKLNFNYKARENLNLVVGGEYNIETFDGIAPPRDLEDLKITTLFVEGMYQSAIGNLTIGLRYDEPNFFDSNLAPRIGLTKTFDKFHVKALYSNSFRSPKIENYVTNPNINTEKTQTYEVELGYQINKDMAITANIFNISSKDTIIFGVNPSNNE